MTARTPLQRRLAALFALAGALGAFLSVGFAIVRGDAWRLPAVLVGMAAVVIGFWYALSRRGAASFVGATLAFAGLVAVFFVTLTGDYRGLPFAVAIALAALAEVLARYALGARRVASAAGGYVDAPAPRRPVLIINPKSGGGKAERFHLVDECKARGIETILLEPGDDLAVLAAEAIARGADVVGMAGGDGSQAIVAKAASEHGIAHVCIPSGTRNHFALDLGIDRDDVVGALEAYSDGVEHCVDLAQVNGRVFVNNACMGLYAKIVQSDAYRDAKLKTAADMLPDMLGPDAAPFDLRFVGPDGADHPTAHIILVSNDPYQLDDLAGRGTRERMDLGTLGIAAAMIAGPMEALAFVSLEAAGKIRTFRGWVEWNTARFRVDSGTAVEIAIDGEALLMEPPLIFESLPGVLRVRLPKHARRMAPAAAAVHFNSSTIRDLVRVAVGHESDPH